MTTPPKRPTLEDRFWAKVEKSADGCWNWTASTRNGYGLIGTGERNEYAHRVSYRLGVGDIPAGMVIRHRCDNRLCVRPDHLEVGTKADNSRDMVERGRSAPNPRANNTHCTNGHPFDEQNTYWFNGARQCRACKTEYERKKRAAAGPTRWPGPLAGEARVVLREAVAEQYRAGETLGSIAAPLGRSQAFVRALLVEAGVTIRPRKYRKPRPRPEETALIPRAVARTAAPANLPAWEYTLAEVIQHDRYAPDDTEPDDDPDD